MNIVPHKLIRPQPHWSRGIVQRAEQLVVAVVLIAASAREVLAGSVCITFWQPGNFVVPQVTSLTTEPGPYPPCEFPDAFYNDLLDNLSGHKDFRIVSKAGQPDLAWLNTYENISTNTVDGGEFPNSGTLEFTDFNLQLFSVSNRGRWILLDDIHVSPTPNSHPIFRNFDFAVFSKSGGNGRSTVSVDFLDSAGTIRAESGVLEFTGSNRFSATTFGGPGTVRIAGITFFGGIKPESTGLELADGFFTGVGNGSGDLNGLASWSGGQFAGNFDHKGVLTVTASVGPGLIDGAVFNNMGTVKGAGLISATNSAFYNIGLVEDTMLVGPGGGEGVPLFENTGIFQNSTNSEITVGLVRFKDQSGTIRTSGGSIDFQGGHTSFAFSMIDGTGTTRVSSDASFQQVSVLPTTRLFLAGGTYSGTGYEAGDIAGPVVWEGGSFSGAFLSKAEITIPSEGTRLLSDGATFVNGGVIDVIADGLAIDGQRDAVTRPSFNNGTAGLLRKSAGDGISRIGNIAFEDTGGTVEVQSGVIEFAGDGRFLGTHFTGPGVVRFKGGAFLGHVIGDEAKIDLAGGLFRGTGNGTGDLFGEASWSGGAFSGNFDNKGVLSITSPGGLSLRDDAVFNNYGTVQGTSLISATNGIFYNYGTVIDAMLVGGGATLPLFENHGWFGNSHESEIIVGSARFHDADGTIVVSGGAIEFSGGETWFTRTKFSGDGNVVISRDARFESVMIDQETHFQLVGGTYTGTGVGGQDIAGPVLWKSGEIAGEFYSKAVVIIPPNSTARLIDGANFYNYGELSDAAYISGTNSSIINAGSVNCGSTVGTFGFGGDFVQSDSGIVKLKAKGLETVLKLKLGGDSQKGASVPNFDLDSGYGFERLTFAAAVLRDAKRDL